MAYYAYKHVRDAIPEDFREQFETTWKEETGEEFDGAADYDGSLWRMAASYIEHIKNQLATRAPSPEPAANTELTAFELGKLRELYETKAHGVNYHDELRLLDEHAAQSKRIAFLERINRSNSDAYRADNDALRSRIAELESALALATEAVAAEARAKVEGLTCTREERLALKMIIEHEEIWHDATKLQVREAAAFNLARYESRFARREAAKAKGDGNG